MAGPTSPDDRAAAAERSVVHLFGGRLLGMPGTHLGRVRYPHTPRLGAPWHYWWQAHYLDALVDAGLRCLRTGDQEAAQARARRGDRLLATVRLRNLGRLPNQYFDDMAWLALASGRLAVLHRALGRHDPGRRLRSSERELTAQLRSAVTDELGGGAYWNKTRDFKNTPATGPVALHLARLGETEAARALVDWLYARLWDQPTGLFLDGIRVENGRERLIGDVWSYNQGTVLGALVTLADPVSQDRAAALVAAVATGLTAGPADAPVLVTHGGGDGGLFTGILARYLALAATDGGPPGDAPATAARLVGDTADAVWAARTAVSDATDVTDVAYVFPDNPADPADPADAAKVELSTQMQAWMTLEAAAAVSAWSGTR